MTRIVGVLLVFMLAAVTAEAGAIRGTLFLSHAAARPDHARDARGALRAQPGVGDAVIYVEKIPDNVERKLSGHGWFFMRRAPMPRLVQSQMRFLPRVMPVAVGTAVQFQNLDHVYHNAFSVSAAKRFDLGKYPPGRLDTVRFERAGVVNLHCGIHPDMIGYVVVLPNHAFARPDSNGTFALPKLPDGAYLVHAWHPRFGDLTARVQMPKHGDADVQMTY
jgi:hypothetical protein